MENIIENKLNGYFIRSKAQTVEQNEKNTRYFATLEKKKSESKLICKLNVNGNIITNQSNIYVEENKFYIALISDKERQIQLITFI